MIPPVLFVLATVSLQVQGLSGVVILPCRERAFFERIPWPMSGYSPFGCPFLSPFFTYVSSRSVLPHPHVSVCPPIVMFFFPADAFLSFLITLTPVPPLLQGTSLHFPFCRPGFSTPESCQAFFYFERVNLFLLSPPEG